MKKIFFAMLIFLIGFMECNAMTNEKYYKTILTESKYITYEISQEEYNSVDLVELLNSNIETEYKRMSINQIGRNIKLSVSWKKTPKYKSYDVISIMSDDVKFNANTIIGEQVAISNKGNDIVNYSISSNNTQFFNNGVGISMNLVNDAIYYDLSLVVSYSGNGKIYGNYRHAQSNVTLSQSQNYYLKNGNIVFKNSSINNKYDSINPVWISI